MNNRIIKPSGNKTSGYHSQNTVVPPIMISSESSTTAQSSDESDVDDSKSINLPVEKDCFVTLEEMYTGCVKEFCYDRWIQDHKGNIAKVKKTIHLNIQPGCLAGTKFVYPGIGDLFRGNRPGDVIVTILQKRHKMFTREHLDLVYRTSIIRQLLERGTKIKVPTLTGEIWVDVKKDEIKRVRGYGFQNPTHQGTFGDLVIKFSVIEAKRVTRSSSGCFQFMHHAQGR